MSKGLTIRSGSVRVRIFRNATNRRLAIGHRQYTRWELRWTDHHGRRRRCKRSNLAEARREAQRIADDLARGHHHAELTLADLASFRAGIVNLYGTGKTLELATAEYAALRRLVPNVPVEEIGRFYIDHRPAVSAELTVADAIQRHLAARAKKGVSARWAGTLKSQLKAFGAAFPGPILKITAEQVDKWVLSLDVGPVTRNNYLAAVQSLYSLPELARMPAREAIQAIDPSDEPEKDPHATDNLWTPEEFRLLLNTALLPAHRHLLPMLVLGGFCKLRNESEAMRARWENVHLRDRQIYTDGKTGERLATLTPNAVRWLKLCAKKRGSVWPWGENKLHRDLRKLAGACEMEWRANALRKSASTYAMKLKPDESTVSTEAGNSPAILRRYYLKLRGITKRVARQWFGIFPPMNERVIVPMTTPENESPNRPLYAHH